MLPERTLPDLKFPGKSAWLVYVMLTERMCSLFMDISVVLTYMYFNGDTCVFFDVSFLYGDLWI